MLKCCTVAGTVTNRSATKREHADSPGTVWNIIKWCLINLRNTMALIVCNHIETVEQFNVCSKYFIFSLSANHKLHWSLDAQLWYCSNDVFLSHDCAKSQRMMLNTFFLLLLPLLMLVNVILYLSFKWDGELNTSMGANNR